MAAHQDKAPKPPLKAQTVVILDHPVRAHHKDAFGDIF
jgi:hypothetical protein